MTGEAEKAHEYIDLEETKQKILRVAEKNYERKPEKLGMIYAAHIVKNMPAADVAPGALPLRMWSGMEIPYQYRRSAAGNDVCKLHVPDGCGTGQERRLLAIEVRI